MNELLKGKVLNKLWQIPAFKRLFYDSNIKKMTHCRCWPQGRAQCFIFAQLSFETSLIQGSGLNIELIQKWSNSYLIRIFTNVWLTKM